MERPIEKFLRDVMTEVNGTDPAIVAMSKDDHIKLAGLSFKVKHMVDVLVDGSNDDANRPRTADEKQRWVNAILAALLVLIQSLLSGQSAHSVAIQSLDGSPTRPS